MLRTLQFIGTVTVLALLAAFSPAHAEDNHPFATAHYVFQVSQGDPERWNLAMGNATNLQKYYGIDKVEIVIVAYGPGLRMLLKDSPVAERVRSLAIEGIEFDACGNTLDGMAHQLGHRPAVNPAAKVVPAGVVRIGELQQKGYIYVKP